MNKFIKKCLISLLVRTSRYTTDKFYLNALCRLRLGYWINWKDPKTFNEKLQWLKLYYHNPALTALVDKERVKDYVSNTIGSEHVIPTLGVWNSFDEIDFDALPDEFVLKCTHDSGGVVICRNKQEFNKKAAERKLSGCLKKNFYFLGREWPYKNVPRKIIAEKYMADNSGCELKDYKFFCFGGVPQMLLVVSERPDIKLDYYDMSLNHLPFTNYYPNSRQTIQVPATFEEMIFLAGKLSAGLPHVRVDMYDINGQVFFGEMTFFHTGGFMAYDPFEWDYKIGEWLTLPEEMR